MRAQASLITRRRAAGLLLTLALVLGAGIPGSAWAAATQSNTQTVSSSSASIPGVASSSGGGIAVPGAAVAINIPPIVIQQNMQIDTTGNANNVQTASNSLTANQQTVAAAGSATATNGGTAMSGTAIATSLRSS